MRAPRRWPAACGPPRVADALDWTRDGAHWPHREASTFVEAGGIRWHVQTLGPARAPVLLLLHGTGASTHSWRQLAPRLARDHRIVMPDLPGHAFTALPARDRMSLPGMAALVAELLRAMRVAPRAVIGHSAGAAIAARLALDAPATVPSIIGINAAMLPIDGPVGRLFSPVAKLLALNPLVPHAFAFTATPRWVVQRLIEGTGSRLDDEGLTLYGRLVSNAAHAGAALAMMAAWDLDALREALPGLRVPLHLIVGARDLAVPPGHAQALARRVPGTTVDVLEGLGHVAHEEDAPRVEAAIRTRLA